MTDRSEDLRGDGDSAVHRPDGGFASLGVDRFARRLPRVETHLDADREALVLTVGLLAALVVFVPAFGAAADALDLPLPLPLLVGVGIACGAYAAVVVALRRWVAGSVVALVVLATFKANVPLFPVARQFPGDIVAELLLVHAPLGVLAIVAVHRGWLGRSRELPVIAFAGFVAATLVPALLGRAPSPLAAASFTLYVLFGLLAFATCVRVVADGVLRIRTVVVSVLLAVGAHAAVGLVQLANQRPFGLTRLGEGGGVRTASLALPAFGDVYLGTFVSGFTGMSFILAYLVVLVLPAGVVLVARLGGPPRYLGAAGLVGLVVVLRGSSSDTARGAVTVAFAAFGLLLAYRYRARIADALRHRAERGSARLREATAAAALVVLGSAIVVLPSSDAGETSRVTPGDADDRSSAAEADPRVDAGSLSDLGGIDLSQLSVPLVDLSNLGVRLQQYVVALDLFLQFPLFGIGGVNYVLVAGEYGVVAPPGQNFPYPVHSMYLTLLAETGAVGTALYLGTVAAVLYAGWRLLGHPGVDGPLVIGVLAGLVGALAFGALDILPLYAGPGFFPFWIVAGALVGEASRREAVPTIA